MPISLSSTDDCCPCRSSARHSFGNSSPSRARRRTALQREWSVVSGCLTHADGSPCRRCSWAPARRRMSDVCETDAARLWRVLVCVAPASASLRLESAVPTHRSRRHLSRPPPSPSPRRTEVPGIHAASPPRRPSLGQRIGSKRGCRTFDTWATCRTPTRPPRCRHEVRVSDFAYGADEA